MPNLRGHLRSRAVSRVIYGAVVGLALVVALEDHPPSATGVTAILLGTAFAAALAELYSELLGERVHLGPGVGRGHLIAIAENATAVAIGAGFPAAFFVIAATGALELATAFSLAKWSGLGLLSFYGFWAGRLSGADVKGSLLQAVAVGGIGALVIAIKALVH